MKGAIKLKMNKTQIEIQEKERGLVQRIEIELKVKGLSQTEKNQLSRAFLKRNPLKHEVKVELDKLLREKYGDQVLFVDPEFGQPFKVENSEKTFDVYAKYTVYLKTKRVYDL